MGVYITKEDALGCAQGYAEQVASAEKYCVETATAINTAIAAVQDNWKGESGAAMLAALQKIQTDLKSVQSRLSSTANAMTSRGWSIYNSWPMDAVEGGDK